MMRRDRKKKIDERECHGAAYTIGKWELGAYIVGLIWDFVLGFIREGQVLEKRSGKSGYRSLLDSLTFTPKFLLFFTVYTLFFWSWSVGWDILPLLWRSIRKYLL